MKKFLTFVKENLDNQKLLRKFNLSPKFINKLYDLDGLKLTKLFLDLTLGVSPEKLVADPIDYVDLEDDGNVSYLKSRYFDEPDKWKTSRRIKTKVNRLLKDIYKETYLNEKINQTDVEIFLNRWNGLFKSAEIFEWRGKELLRAYNYKREIDLHKFGFTCANFGQKEPGGSRYEEPLVSWFDVYTKNPENIGVVVAMIDNRIVGRKTFQQGIQLYDRKKYKSGEFYTMKGNYYGELGRKGLYDQMIDSYLEKKYKPHYLDDFGFVINIETRFQQYPPFDSMYVNFNKNELSNEYLNEFTSTYKAKCPASLVLEREKEEEMKEKSNS